jgi:hypothetical protein
MYIQDAYIIHYTQRCATHTHTNTYIHALFVSQDVIEKERIEAEREKEREKREAKEAALATAMERVSFCIHHLRKCVLVCGSLYTCIHVHV